jgi:diadenosine tetraphosphate (Ap4A) HIT family hydrolase
MLQDETIVAFRDIRPAAKHHYLICPKQHISSSKELTKDQIPLGKLLTRCVLTKVHILVNEDVEHSLTAK